MNNDELTDRLAIREVIDSYAHNADRSRSQELAALFAEDAVVEVYQGDPQ